MDDKEKSPKIQLWELQAATKEFLGLIMLFVIYVIPTGMMLLIAQSSNGKIGALQVLEILIVMGSVLTLVLVKAKNSQLIGQHHLQILWKNKLWILGAIAIQILLIYLFPLLLSKLHINFSVSQNQATLAAATAKIPIFLLIISTTIYAPICEEIIFRAGVFERLFPTRRSLSLLISTLLFAMAHMGLSLDWWNWLIYLTMGLIFGIVYLKTQHVENSIAVHVLWNLFASIINLS
ncbi:MAG: CPBP family intramembrane metalloprotease [Streptococcaceae bacterium]|jgi:membrane protease YdiL (CAAX protease family)|nr:CPBP family intramembrane metalloprotease [Streptococcaceae bacterium]